MLTNCNMSAGTDPVIAFGRNAAAQPNGDTISGSRYRIWGMTNGAVWLPLMLFFGHDAPATVKPEEFCESTIGKRRYKRAPECAICSRPLRARPWNRNIGIEAAAAICQQVTGAKEPVKAAKEASGKVFASTAGPAPDTSRFWLNRGRAMPKSPCCGSSS
jgi:hypothetical protein